MNQTGVWMEQPGDSNYTVTEESECLVKMSADIVHLNFYKPYLFYQTDGLPVVLLTENDYEAFSLHIL